SVESSDSPRPDLHRCAFCTLARRPHSRRWLDSRPTVRTTQDRCRKVHHSLPSPSIIPPSDALRPGLMDITILAYLEPGDDKPDIVMEQVATALESRGHRTSILTIRNDVAELVEGLKKRKPQMVFNLVESFGDDILGGTMGVAGVLDLMQLPYT